MLQTKQILFSFKNYKYSEKILVFFTLYLIKILHKISLKNMFKNIYINFINLLT